MILCAYVHLDYSIHYFLHVPCLCRIPTYACRFAFRDDDDDDDFADGDADADADGDAGDVDDDGDADADADGGDGDDISNFTSEIWLNLAIPSRVYK